MIVIFLGPSLALDEAQKILPQAHFLPPVQSGDILRVLRLKPTIIGIIDGYFENVSAVWHKEILYALSKGIQVMGCSSMGALRVSELAAYGMVPIGKIAQDYLSGIMNDDDEVALLHSPSPSGYVALTEALVNIRAILQLAKQKEVIDASAFSCILKIAKKLHYRDRFWKKILRLAYEEDIDREQMVALEQWLEIKDNKVDVKRNDAILLLETITVSSSTAANKPFILNRSAFFRALQKNTACRPFSSYQSWLPLPERVALAARYLDQHYILLRRLAYLLAACYSLARQRKIEPSNEDPFIFFMGTSSADFTRHGESANGLSSDDCTPEEKTKFLNRMRTITVLLKQEQQATDLPGSADDYLLLLMRLAGDYALLKKEHPQANYLSHFEQSEPNKYRLMRCVAHCWWFIERCALRLGLQPDFDSLEEYANQFRLANHLETTEKIQQWLEDNDLDINGYQYLMSANVRLKFLVFENNLDVLNCSLEDDDTVWLLDALRLSGFYEEAKKVLVDPQKLVELKERIKNKVPNLEKHALFLDFIGGEQEFTGETLGPKQTQRDLVLE